MKPSKLEDVQEVAATVAALNTSLVLREIVPLSEERSRSPMAVSLWPPSSSVSSSSVTVDVGGTDRFRCPIYLLAFGSSTLRGIVEDLVDGGVEASPGNRPLESSSATTVAEARAGGEGRVEEKTIPLPFLSKEVFTTVALYWEHFSPLDTQLVATPQKQPKPLKEPSVLREPLCFADLYTLSAWGQVFILQRLIKLTELLDARQQQQQQQQGRSAGKKKAEQGSGRSGGGGAEDAEEERACLLSSYLRNGAWVDAVGAPLAGIPTLHQTERSAGAPAPVHTRQEDDSKQQESTVDARAASSVPFSELVFTLPERRIILSRVMAVLEAATRLGVASLSSLCAALVANMIVQLGEEEISQLFSGRDGSARLPPFTDARKKDLLAKYPWADVKVAVSPTPFDGLRITDAVRESGGEAVEADASAVT